MSQEHENESAFLSRLGTPRQFISCTQLASVRHTAVGVTEACDVSLSFSKSDCTPNLSRMPRRRRAMNSSFEGLSQAKGRLRWKWSMIRCSAASSPDL